MASYVPADTIGNYCKQHGDADLVRVIEIRHPASGAVFVDRLYKELDTVIRDLEESSSVRQQDEEDRITVDIVAQLRRAGYDASHDTYTKGHVDIRVAQDSFVWLGEGKIHRDYDWLFKGMNQLLGRYTTGREEGAGILIYIKGKNAKAVLEEWRKRLVLGHPCGL